MPPPLDKVAALMCCLLIALMASGPPLPRPVVASFMTVSEKQQPRRAHYHHDQLQQRHQQHHNHHNHHNQHHHHQHHKHGKLWRISAGPRRLEPREGSLSWPATTTTFDMIATSPVEGQQQRQQQIRRRHVVVASRRRSKRDQLHLAVNRLKILESLDDQLRAFASDLAQRRQASISRCELPLKFLGANKSNGRHHSNEEDHQESDDRAAANESQEEVDGESEEGEEEEEEQVKSPSCLSSDHLRRQIPAYMLNLHTKLRGEARSLQEAARLMPYRSLRMRSFRQPPALYHAAPPRRPQASSISASSSSSSSSTLLASANPSSQALQTQVQAQATTATALEEAFSSLVDESELVVELNVMPASTLRAAHKIRLTAPDQTDKAPLANGQSPWSSSCDLSERLKPARDRTQLCYWFKLAANQPINGSLSSPGARPLDEQLIEAELHLYKLQPDPKLLKWHQQQFNSSFGGNEYHLRTNLLEVSLYQVLAKKSGQSENPLRLLDIRRIDLESSGWESFYVKRAVQDWLHNSSSNLGLVIKAKSMFDEPIRIGLIRFADLYDHHHWRAQSGTNSTLAATRISGRSLEMIDEEAIEFDLSHQPALVIYTSGASRHHHDDQKDLESNG